MKQADLSKIIQLSAVVIQIVMAVVSEFLTGKHRERANLAAAMIRELLIEFADLSQFLRENPEPSDEQINEWRERRLNAREALVMAIEEARKREEAGQG